MNRRCVVGIVAGSLCCAAVLVADGGRPRDGDPCEFAYWDNGMSHDVLIASQLDATLPFHCQFADDFILDHDHTLRDVHWVGGFIEEDPVDPDFWRIMLYADNGTGTAPTGGPGDPTLTALCMWELFGDDVDVEDQGDGTFRYSVTLDLGYELTAGERYWIAIQAVLASPSRWGWAGHASQQLHCGVHGFPLEAIPYWTDLAYDAAFCLTSKPWTVMVFLNGDNDLDGDSLATFNQMELAADNPAVNIIVCWDRLAGGKTGYFEVQHDTDPGELAEYEYGVNWFGPSGELDMGDPVTLTDFTQWALAYYPAEHYLLAIWNHGGGWGPRGPRGVSWDYHPMSSFFTTNEIRDAMVTVKSQIGRKLDILGMDACLMQMVETTYPVRDSCDYHVGSEEFEYSPGWAYHKFLANIQFTSAPQQVSQDIVDTFIAQSCQPTQSAVQTDGLALLANRISNLATTLQAQLDDEDQQTYIQAARCGAVTFEYGELPEQHCSNSYVDLDHFCQRLIDQEETEQVIKNAAQAVRTALEAVVTANEKNGDYYQPAGGLSIYFPDHEPDYVGSDNYYANYMGAAELDFVAETFWDEFLVDYVATCPQVGDVNCDGTLNNFDIYPFIVLLLTVEPYDSYYEQWPEGNHRNADANCDADINNFDISPFVDLLIGGH